MLFGLVGCSTACIPLKWQRSKVRTSISSVELVRYCEQICDTDVVKLALFAASEPATCAVLHGAVLDVPSSPDYVN
jgi:hypothetical protein